MVQRKQGLITCQLFTSFTINLSNGSTTTLCPANYQQIWGEPKKKNQYKKKFIQQEIKNSRKYNIEITLG